MAPQDSSKGRGLPKGPPDAEAVLRPSQGGGGNPRDPARGSGPGGHPTGGGRPQSPTIGRRTCKDPPRGGGGPTGLPEAAGAPGRLARDGSTPMGPLYGWQRPRGLFKAGGATKDPPKGSRDPKGPAEVVLAALPGALAWGGIACKGTFGEGGANRPCQAVATPRPLPGAVAWVSLREQLGMHSKDPIRRIHGALPLTVAPQDLFRNCGVPVPSQDGGGALHEALASPGALLGAAWRSWDIPKAAGSSGALLRGGYALLDPLPGAAALGTHDMSNDEPSQGVAAPLGALPQEAEVLLRGGSDPSCRGGNPNVPALAGEPARDPPGVVVAPPEAFQGQAGWGATPGTAAPPWALSMGGNVPEALFRGQLIASRPPRAVVTPRALPVAAAPRSPAWGRHRLQGHFQKVGLTGLPEATASTPKGLWGLGNPRSLLGAAASKGPLPKSGGSHRGPTISLWHPRTSSRTVGPHVPSQRAAAPWGPPRAEPTAPGALWEVSTPWSLPFALTGALAGAFPGGQQRTQLAPSGAVWLPKGPTQGCRLPRGPSRRGNGGLGVPVRGCEASSGPIQRVWRPGGAPRRRRPWGDPPKGSLWGSPFGWRNRHGSLSGQRHKGPLTRAVTSQGAWPGRWRPRSAQEAWALPKVLRC
ncbi:collagen alpha-1(III) chain-like [Homarus americanus]|uniref:collagen alpha-1(III) chain-like n=1 Tax=Homarus americanus TaxID=6706 RepID=UPI001C48A80B|nr:collagen alpha-1(III) chain-like [Homarus americanus]